jgi:hypothetical protein
MLNIHQVPSPKRLPSPIPGVPDSQARALDRRLRLHRQLRSFRDPRLLNLSSLPEPSEAVTSFNEVAGPGPV